MPITINGSGTVTGISAGGLPDGCITTADLDSAVPVAKAWVNFNGAGAVAIRASYNVSSITDSGVGNFTVNFTTAMPDANYSVQQSAGDGAITEGRHVFGYYGAAPTTTSYRFATATFAGADYDPPYVAVAVFR